MSEPVELRGEVPREVVDVIDALVQANPGSNRMTFVRDILSKWVEQKVHESTVVLAVTRGKGIEVGGERKS